MSMFARATAKRWVASIGAGASLAYTTSLEEKPSVQVAAVNSAIAKEHQKVTPIAISPYKKENEKASAPLKRYTLQEFTEMSEQGRLVVGLKGFVYDVSNFSGHPGGVGRLEMASGNDLEAFWNVYTQHNRGHIVDNLLEIYKIGTLSPKDAEELRNRTKFDNPYTNDPPCKKDLLCNTRYPYNAEGKLRELTNSFITPISHHFVRNHGMVPDIDPKDYKLTVTGVGLKETVFTLDELKQFPRVDVTTVIQCNGNRREDYHFEKDGVPAFGPPHWVAGAIGCATWTGVRLRDLLHTAGMKVDDISTRKIAAPKEAQYIGLLAYDTDECGNQYCCSFPFEKAVDPYGDVIVAYQMNGQDIPRQHGYPVRCIVPGNAGARNCKYLERVTVTESPCSGDTNWKQYAVHSPDVPLQKLLDFNIHKKELVKDPPVQEMPVQSMVTIPSAGDVIRGAGKKSVFVKGFAWGGGGQGVNRVDVSIDGGNNFTRAEMLDRPVQQPRKAQWAWVFFEKEVPLTLEMQAKLNKGETVELEVLSKACNMSWNVQPENPGPQWNPHGCCVNHWYRVPIKLDPNAKEDTCGVKEGCFENKPSGGKFKTEFNNMKQCTDCS